MSSMGSISGTFTALLCGALPVLFLGSCAQKDATPRTAGTSAPTPVSPPSIVEQRPYPNGVSASQTFSWSDGKKPRKVDYPDDGVPLGQGWISTTNQKTTARCVDVEFTDDKSQDKQLELKEVVDKASLLNQLDVSAEASVKGLAGSASSKVHFISSVRVDEEQSNFSVHARVRNGAEYVIPPNGGRIDLTPTFAKLAKDNPPQFLIECGDSFVYARFGGAELSAILTFHVYSVDEKKALSRSFNGSGFGALDAGGTVDQTMTKYTSSKQFSVAYHEAGGSGDPIPTDQPGLVSVVHSLPQLAKAAPQYFTIEIVRYDSLNSWPGKRTDWLYTEYAAIAEQYQRLWSLRETVEQIIANPEPYILDRGVTLDSLKTLNNELLARVKSLTGTAQDCIKSSGTNCTIKPNDQVSDYEYRIKMPVRRDACPAFQELETAKKNAAVKWRTWDDAIAVWRSYAEEHRVNDKQALWDAQTLNERRDYQNAVMVVNKLTASFPKGLQDAISSQWIEMPARARCSDDVLDPGCIDESQQQGFKDRIVVN